MPKHIECVSVAVDGSWNFWGPWSECTEMCDGGTRRKERKCNLPEPKNGGKKCEGEDFQETTCNEWECPRKGILLGSIRTTQHAINPVSRFILKKKKVYFLKTVKI